MKVRIKKCKCNLANCCLFCETDDLVIIDQIADLSRDFRR